jgi:c(7)-type cytochrome triheme protein
MEPTKLPTLMASKRHIPGLMRKCLLILALVSFVMPAMAAVPGDILYERRASESGDSESEMLAFPPAVFPHWIHRINYRCDACHDSLFEMKRGGTLVTMDLMSQGKVCGTCHDGDLAFGSDFQSCDRCHVEPEK